MFTWRDRRGDRSQLQLWLPLTCDRIHSVSHELNMFSSCDRAYNCRTDYTNWLMPFTLTTEMMRHLECGQTLKLREIFKKTALFFGKWSKRIRGYSYQDVRWWKPAFLQCAEMQNYWPAEYGKVIKGNLWNVLHFIFRKLSLENFRHSIIHIPQNIRAHVPWACGKMQWSILVDFRLYAT